MSESPTVFIVDDDPAVGRALSAGIAKLMQLPVRSFTSAEDFLAAYDGDQVGCLVLDIKMPGMSGLELQEALRAADKSLPVIMISGNAQIPMAVQAMKNGAVTLLEKPFELAQLKEQITAALAVAQVRHQCERERRSIRERLATLTARERDVLDHLCAGRTNKEIATLLGTSLPTLDKHRWKVLEKMQVDNPVELVMLMSKLEN